MIRCSNKKNVRTDIKTEHTKKDNTTNAGNIETKNGE